MVDKLNSIEKQKEISGKYYSAPVKYLLLLLSLKQRDICLCSLIT